MTLSQEEIIGLENQLVTLYAAHDNTMSSFNVSSIPDAATGALEQFNNAFEKGVLYSASYNARLQENAKGRGA